MSEHRVHDCNGTANMAKGSPLSIQRLFIQGHKQEEQRGPRMSGTRTALNGIRDEDSLEPGLGRGQGQKGADLRVKQG